MKLHPADKALIFFSCCMVVILSGMWIGMKLNWQPGHQKEIYEQWKAQQRDRPDTKF